MGKSYWHSAGSGALGMGGPWNSPTRRERSKGAPARRLIRRIVVGSLLLAFVAGVVISLYQRVIFGESSAHDTAAVAFGSVGLTISEGLAWVMTLLSLDDYAAAVQRDFFVYAEIPYQLCAFAGAYVATVVIGLPALVIAMFPSQR
jgi:hypothetical protein